MVRSGPSRCDRQRINPPNPGLCRSPIARQSTRVESVAVRLLPADLTLQYQLARAVELVDPPRGQSMQDSLVKKGYPAAFDNAGSLLLNDRGCKQHCVNEAVKLFKKGASSGESVGDLVVLG